jgi:hypothetical protein
MSKAENDFCFSAEKNNDKFRSRKVERTPSEHWRPLSLGLQFTLRSLITSVVSSMTGRLAMKSRSAFSRMVSVLLRITGALVVALSAWDAACAQEDAKIAPSASMNEQVLEVPVDAQGAIRLEVTVLTPDGAGPFPLVIMNHGSSRGPAD